MPHIYDSLLTLDNKLNHACFELTTLCFSLRRSHVRLSGQTGTTL